ncbi:RidA family protein [Nocardioides immobilis]|uniref:RidA family protein n=1 Tax=Nocardioides immobilis TaxID=2049295 RepID=A0A417Y027_9ACTN|nr:RidA family protein [Nocardioides immobilis]RHW25937.1 RidA family protein [Nocardioides immobilis]
MSIEFTNPDGLPEIDLYRQVSIATGSRIVHIAGQVSWGAGEVGESDLASQIEDSYAHVATALAGAGGSVDDIVDLTMFVVDWAPARMSEVVDGLDRAAGRLGRRPVPPATLIGVAALAAPEYLVELKAVAVLP